MIINSLQAFSSPACEVGAFSNSRFHRQYGSVIGIESYRQLLVRLAKSSLGVDDLSSQQMEALENYHSVVRGEKGKDGTPTRVGNYTLGQRRKIIRYLESKGFSREQVSRLIEDGVVEIESLYSSKINTRRIVQRIEGGEEIFIGFDGRIRKITKILEQTDNSIVLKTKAPNSSTNYIKKILNQGESYIIFNTRPGEQVVLSYRKAIKSGLLPKNPSSQDLENFRNTLSKYMSEKDGLGLNRSYGKLNNSFISDKAIVENPAFESVFVAASSTRKEVSLDELNLPPSANKEAQLAEQGYTVSYTRGLDKVNEQAAVRKRLQELKANPRTTHVEYFADQIPDHIAYIRKGLEDNYSGDSKLEQLKHLEDMERAARKAISDKKVTYKWWLQFNTMLSNVMSGKKPTAAPLVELESIVSDFPVRLVVPTIEEESVMGTIAFNRASSESIYPAGLINKLSIEADGRPHDAYTYFGHDLVHARQTGNKPYTGYSAGHRLFHKRVLRNIEELSPDERKKAEVVYYIMTHESNTFNLSSPVTRGGT